MATKKEIALFVKENCGKLARLNINFISNSSWKPEYILGKILNNEDECFYVKVKPTEQAFVELKLNREMSHFLFLPQELVVVSNKNEIEQLIKKLEL